MVLGHAFVPEPAGGQARQEGVKKQGLARGACGDACWGEMMVWARGVRQCVSCVAARCGSERESGQVVNLA